MNNNSSAKALVSEVILLSNTLLLKLKDHLMLKSTKEEERRHRLSSTQWTYSPNTEEISSLIRYYLKTHSRRIASIRTRVIPIDLDACFVFFLPHIMDSSEKQRTDTLNMIKNVMKDFLSYPLVFLWSQGGDQYDFESQFPLGAGYPSLLTVIPKKKKYSVMRTGQGFGAENIKSYINNLLAGRETAGDLPAVLSSMRKVDPWKLVTK